jgi:hypothetical protein
LSSGSSSDEAPFPSPLPDHKFKSEVFKSILAAGSSGGDSAAQEFNGEKPSAALTARNLDSNLNLTVLASLVKQIVEDELRPEESSSCAKKSEKGQQRSPASEAKGANVDIERRAALSPKMGNSVSVPSATALGGPSSRGPSTQDAPDDSKDRSDDQLDVKLEYENDTQSTTRDIALLPPVSNSDEAAVPGSWNRSLCVDSKADSSCFDGSGNASRHTACGAANSL